MSAYLGTNSIWHALALLLIGSGLYTDQDFPELFNKPFLATTMTDLWGRRYHQLLRVSLVYENYLMTEEDIM